MLESFNTKHEMEYQRLTQEEQERRGILGRLIGPIADTINPTRNGRRYTAELWEKVFSDPIMIEKLENRCVFGELGHPADRQEIDMEKIAICLAEKPKKGDDGKLYGVFDILATPNGRILKTMCDYGCTIGVSSRGCGDTFEDYNGVETVEADSYECECWDAVLLPAIKSARQRYVTEGFNLSSKNEKMSLKKALKEELENSSEEDKRVMQQTLDDLSIDYQETTSEDIAPELVAFYTAYDLVKKYKEGSITEEELKNNIAELEDDIVKEISNSLVELINIPEKVDNIDVSLENQDDAENNGDEIIQELQEALSKQMENEAQIKKLQEKLSVCYTKEARYSNKLNELKSQIAEQQHENQKLNKVTKTLRTRFAILEEEFNKISSDYKALNEKYTAQKLNSKNLNESVASKKNEVSKLHEQLKEAEKTHQTQLNEAKIAQRELSKKVTLLESKLQEEATSKKIIQSQAESKLESSKQLVEKYKSVARSAVDKYINVQATRLGLSSSDIKNKLSENYSFNDIDRVCEELKQYKLTLNSLPFTTLNTPQKVKMQIKEAKKPTEYVDHSFDDDVDESLLTFTK